WLSVGSKCVLNGHRITLSGTGSFSGAQLGVYGAPLGAGAEVIFDGPNDANGVNPAVIESSTIIRTATGGGNVYGSINHRTISTQTAGHTVTVHSATNQNWMSATNGGTLWIDSELSQSSVNAATISINGGAL